MLLSGQFAERFAAALGPVRDLKAADAQQADEAVNVGAGLVVDALGTTDAPELLRLALQEGSSSFTPARLDGASVFVRARDRQVAVAIPVDATALAETALRLETTAPAVGPELSLNLLSGNLPPAVHTAALASLVAFWPSESWPRALTHGVPVPPRGDLPAHIASLGAVVRLDDRPHQVVHLDFARANPRWHLDESAKVGLCASTTAVGQVDANVPKADIDAAVANVYRELFTDVLFQAAFERALARYANHDASEFRFRGVRCGLVEDHSTGWSELPPDTVEMFVSGPHGVLAMEGAGWSPSYVTFPTRMVVTELGDQAVALRDRVGAVGSDIHKAGLGHFSHPAVLQELRDAVCQLAGVTDVLTVPTTTWHAFRLVIPGLHAYMESTKTNR